jgi:hypothetical protein
MVFKIIYANMTGKMTHDTNIGQKMEATCKNDFGSTL